jgi:hypothetical protein
MFCEHCEEDTRMTYTGRISVSEWPSAADLSLDQALADRIRARDTDCVICGIALDDYDDADTCDHCAENLAAAAASARDGRSESGDPVIREIGRYREPRIQDGHRLAKHLYAGASALQDRLPGLATSMREAADALREVSA